VVHKNATFIHTAVSTNVNDSYTVSQKSSTPNSWR